ncbi:MAG: hypothetical protein JNJ69_18585 [Leptospiraceae bacterium]|nr:hypothetical protein [Leptospiraceae bacterium]
MIHFWRLGLKRAPIMWILAGVLYLIAYVETAVFVRYQKFLSTSNPLLLYAFALLLIGFAFGLLMVQAILCRSLRYEVGNFETLGFTRLKILGYYAMQNLFVALLALLPAVSTDLILNAFFSQKNMPVASFERVIVAQFVLGFTLIFTFANFMVLYSRQSPALLLKEKH